MKKICITSLLFLIYSGVYCQDQNDFNLPPEIVIHPKTDVNYDYSKKLEHYEKHNIHVPNKTPFKLGYTDLDLQEMKNNDIDSYNYYLKAKLYFESLSEKVFEIFTSKELWDIYMFDSKLAKRLQNIK